MKKIMLLLLYIFDQFNHAESLVIIGYCFEIIFSPPPESERNGMAKFEDTSKATN